MANVYIIRQNVAGPQSGRILKDVGVFETEERAYEENLYVTGPMGVPLNFGGEIWEVEVGSSPIAERRVWGERKNWLGEWDYGWTDLRDQPDENNPEWVQFKNLRKKFESRQEDKMIAEIIAKRESGKPNG